MANSARLEILLDSGKNLWTRIFYFVNEVGEFHYTYSKNGKPSLSPADPSPQRMKRNSMTRKLLMLM